RSAYPWLIHLKTNVFLWPEYIPAMNTATADSTTAETMKTSRSRRILGASRITFGQTSHVSSRGARCQGVPAGKSHPDRTGVPTVDVAGGIVAAVESAL